MVILISSIFCALLTLGYLGLFLFLRRGWRKVDIFHDQTGHHKTTVSVLIAARNEENTISKTIDDILGQNYPPHLFEIIIVDDHSTDRTSEIISSYANRGVRLITLNENEALNSYKKKAISEAIKLSQAELIVTTDADCRMGSTWLRNIVGFYESGDYKMISSPVIFFEERSKFEEMQSLEFLFLIGLGAAGIGNKIPSTCNGANLAYRRDVFFELKGFQGIDDLASGDDELFLHKVALAYPQGIGFCKSREAMVYTHAKSTLKDFIQQRKRWASKSTRYKNKGIILIGSLIWLFNLMIIVIGCLGFLDSDYWSICFGVIVFKMLTELIFLTPLCSFVDRVKLLWYQPLLTVVHIFYLIYIGIAGNTGKYNWKGRMVR